MSEIVQISVSGQSKSGLTSSLLNILAVHGVPMLDVGQAMIHDTMVLVILAQLPSPDGAAPVLKDLLFEIHRQGLQAHFTPINQVPHGPWLGSEAHPRHIVTLLGRSVSAEQIARIAQVITENALHIEDIVRLSGPGSLHTAEDGAGRACIELTLRGQPLDLDAMKAAFVTLSEALDVDISFQADDFYRRNRRLVVFDMDSTLIRQEVIDELAYEAGVGAEVSRITEAGMRGEQDFKESLRQRVALLEGLPETVLARVAERLTLTEGAQRLLQTLRKLGYKTAVISGGFAYFGHYLQRSLPLDYVYANEPEIRDGCLTGRVVGEIIDGEKKAQLLCTIAQREGIELEQVIAVGDGANDLPMLKLAGLGIAFHAKPMVQKSARQAISTIGLDGILYLMGMKDADNPH
ncbi:phosphoserine phosphatase SerB [Nitrococcus mobilis]|uniref:Phosphoserine phosphatase n=1 Tax=Nitrococcus mobilis Nb-231 TaxID=314278 RepID=A4BQ81_9GAMM|nr:phosphoserine phosphatase SerB [Nitrococcus mobilis]EAR22236.1 phosphoserine phosphatase SerB [Nitrococcus mobilis Nb-231]